MDLYGFTWIYMETLLSVVVDTFYKETMTIYVSVDCKNIQKPIKIHQTAIQNLSKIHQKPFNMYQNPTRMDLHGFTWIYMDLHGYIYIYKYIHICIYISCKI